MASTGLLLGLGLLTKFSGLVTLGRRARGARRRARRSSPRAGRRCAARRCAAPGSRRSRSRWPRRITRAISSRSARPSSSRAATRWWPRSSADSRPDVRRWRDFVTILAAHLQRSEPARAPHVSLGVGKRVREHVGRSLPRVRRRARARGGARGAALDDACSRCWACCRRAGARGRRARAARRGARPAPRAVDSRRCCVSAATLGSFALFAWRVPIWSALKASYLLGLSLPVRAVPARAPSRSCSSAGGAARARARGRAGGRRARGVARRARWLRAAAARRRAGHRRRALLLRRVRGRAARLRAPDRRGGLPGAVARQSRGGRARRRPSRPRAHCSTRAPSRSSSSGDASIAYRHGQLAVATALDGDLRGRAGAARRGARAHERFPSCSRTAARFPSRWAIRPPPPSI